MADIRINALATTAASTASDDFVAVDGSANGTRKLNAYSPTFGGNLTVSGTDVKINNAAGYFYVDSGSSLTGMLLSRTNNILELSTANNVRLTINAAGNTTLSGNLTVSGTAINLSTNNSTDKVVSIGYSTVPLYLTSSYDGSTFGLSGFSANSRPSGSSYTTPSNTSYGNLYFLAKIAASDTASAFEWKHAPRTAGTPVTTSLMTLNGSGNLLIGTTTDGGQKLQVSGSAKIGSTSYEEFGTNGTAQFYAASGGTAALTLTSAGYYDWRIRGGSTSMTIVRDNTDMLSFDSSSNATFAGAITSSRPYQDISSGLSNIYVYSTDTAAQDKGGTIQLGGAYTGTTTTTFGGVRGSKESTTAGETGGQLEFFTRANGGAMTRRAYISSTGNATFTGSIAIGNTVNTVSPTSPNRTITMVIGGTTYYIHAKTTND